MNKYLIIILLFYSCGNKEISINNKMVIKKVITKESKQPEKKDTSFVRLKNDEYSLKAPYVLLISIDGNRFDYIDKYSPPNLKKFQNSSLRSKGLRPVFPSKTFTNHYSMITGLKAENHGIVANSFFDPIRFEKYIIGKKMTLDGSWYGGSPIWNEAMRQGMVSASYYWVGSEADIEHTRPTYYFPFSMKTPKENQVKQVVNWFELPAKIRPHFVTLYFHDVDDAGHQFGPNSKEVAQSLHDIDKHLGVLFKKIEELDIKINIVIVSDHGMREVKKDGTIILSDYISKKALKILRDGKTFVGHGTLGLVYPQNKEEENFLYSELKKVPHINIKRPIDYPEHYGYTHNSRIGKLIVSSDLGYYFIIESLDKSIEPLGSHGYDPHKDPQMNGIFMAKGPNIINTKLVEIFDNIQVYPFVMNILGLKIPTNIDANPLFLKETLK